MKVSMPTVQSVLVLGYNNVAIKAEPPSTDATGTAAPAAPESSPQDTLTTPGPAPKRRGRQRSKQTTTPVEPEAATPKPMEPEAATPRPMEPEAATPKPKRRSARKE